MKTLTKEQFKSIAKWIGTVLAVLIPFIAGIYARESGDLFGSIIGGLTMLEMIGFGAYRLYRKIKKEK